MDKFIKNIPIVGHAHCYKIVMNCVYNFVYCFGVPRV